MAEPAKATKCFCVLLKDLFVLLGKIVLSVLYSGYLGIVPRSKKNLQGEIVLVTGAGAGLGRELALRFSTLGAAVVLWDVNEKAIQSVKSEILSLGGTAYAYQCDVSNLETVYRVGACVRQEVGDVTILVNNAGILQNVPFTDLDNSKIKKTLEVNLLAHFWTIKFFLPRMIELEKGHIVAISSLAGFVGWLFMADYCASKFGIIGMMEAVEEELRIAGKGNKIHCTTACPVTIDTGLNQSPTTRMPWLIPILTAQYTAADIVAAVQRNERLVTIPRRLMCSLFVQRLFPRRVIQLVLDFLEYNIVPNQP